MVKDVTIQELFKNAGKDFVKTNKNIITNATTNEVVQILNLADIPYTGNVNGVSAYVGDDTYEINSR